jgi:hypothetical protein
MPAIDLGPCWNLRWLIPSPGLEGKIIMDNRVVISCAVVLALTGCTQSGQLSGEQGGPGAQPAERAPQPGTVYEGTVRGKISESGSRYVIEDISTGTFYTLSDEPGLKSFVGKTVTIEGHIDPNSKSIHVHHISPAG